MRKIILFCFCFLFLLNPFYLFAQEYSLTDLFRLGLERSETIKISEEDLYIAEREKDKALAVLFPTLSAFGNHIRYTAEKRQLNFLLQPDYTNEWGVRLDQSLSLSGREFTALNIARETIKRSSFDLNTVKEEKLLNIATQYYAVLRAQKGQEIARANVKRLQKYRDASEIRLKVGEATKTVLLRAEAELAGSKSEMIEAENNLRIAKVILARTAGIKGDYDVKERQGEIQTAVSRQLLISLGILNEGCTQQTLDCLKERALSERAEMRASKLQKQIAGHEVKYARGSYWPTLSLEGVYFKQENEPSSSFALNERIYGGVRLDFPFFEGGLRRAEVREAKAKIRQAEWTLNDVTNEIYVEVENTYLSLIKEAAVLDQLQAEVEYALDNFNAVSKQFQYGLADSLDVIDANTLLVTTERELANARYIYQLVILSLKRVTGLLLNEVVNPQPATSQQEAEGQ
jgi:outer membrane protein